MVCDMLPLALGLWRLCGVVAVGGFVRVYVTNGSLVSSFAISTSLFLIVVSSVFTGTVLPFALARAGVDPANAGTSIQVRRPRSPPAQSLAETLHGSKVF